MAPWKLDAVITPRKLHFICDNAVCRLRMSPNCLIAGTPHRTPLVGAYSAPSDPLIGGEGCKLPIPPQKKTPSSSVARTTAPKHILWIRQWQQREHANLRTRCRVHLDPSHRSSSKVKVTGQGSRSQGEKLFVEFFAPRWSVRATSSDLGLGIGLGGLD